MTTIDFAPAAPIRTHIELSANVPSVPAPLDPVAEAARAEERFARTVAGYLIRSLFISLVIVGVYCHIGTHREAGEILMVALASMGGVCGLEWLARIVERGPRG